MSITNGIITNMGRKLGPSANGDLQSAFGSSQNSQAWYFSTAPIKLGAMKKPFLNTTAIFANMQAREDARVAANYGLTIPELTPAQIVNSSYVKWTLHRPDGTSYPRRAQDFEGYYHGAPDAPVYCTAPGNSILVNVINVYALNPCAFFVYHKDGALKDCAPDSSGGCGQTGSGGRNTTQIAACLSVGEVKTDGGAILTDLTNPRLGLAFNVNSTLKFVGCTANLTATQSQRNNNMFVMNKASFNGIALGTYTATACIRFGDLTGYKYVPLPAVSGICNNIFTLEIGGIDKYTYWKRGLSASNTSSGTGTIRTTLSTVYATIRVQNNSGMDHLSDADVSGWILVVTITGTVNGLDINPPARRITMRNFYPGTSTFLTIPNGGTTDILFQIDKIWNQDPTEAAVVVSSGSIDIEAYLYYNAGGADTAFTRAPAAQQQLLHVNYGN